MPNSLQSLRAKAFTFDSSIEIAKKHYLFRYPAKFHTPIARELVSRYSVMGQTIVDPFCGSGTLLIEAQQLERHCIGIDIDPLAAFITSVKTKNWSIDQLSKTALALESSINSIARSDSEYIELSTSDITEKSMIRVISAENLWLPELPNIDHWFRRYVLVDMARLLAILESSEIGLEERPFFLLCFASAIRSFSNADPVPVSGLEVTSHMRKKDALGRIINPYALFKKYLQKALSAIATDPKIKSNIVSTVYNGDATTMSSFLKEKIDICITSPPYHSAVDYYRRHTLEMYWLRLVKSHGERLELRSKYVGQSSVPAANPRLKEKLDTPLAKKWERKIRSIDSKRANAFSHYATSIQQTFQQLDAVLPQSGLAVMVIGKSRWNGNEIPTSSLFSDLAAGTFALKEHYWYPLKNRYMSYTRHNGANIDKEYVAVFERA